TRQRHLRLLPGWRRHRRLDQILRFGKSDDTMTTFSGIALNRATSAANRLTKAPTYSSLWDVQNMHGYKASCAGCATTPHSSNPTLSTPVIGLLGIIQDQ